MEIRTIFINVILVVIVVSSMIAFAVIFQENNDAKTKYTDNPQFANINKSVSQMVENTQGSEASSMIDVNGTLQAKTETTFGWVIWTGIISFGNAVIKLPIQGYNLITGTLADVIGINVVYLNMITVLIVVSLMILLWRFWRSGQ